VSLSLSLSVSVSLCVCVCVPPWRESPKVNVFYGLFAANRCVACLPQTGLWPVSQQVSMLTFQKQNQKLTVNLLMDHYNISPKQGTWEIIIYIGS
jgi:hypothetical protein